MEATTLLEHYRLSRKYDGAPTEIGRTGPAIHYKGMDARSGAPVVITLVPVASIEEADRARFEEQARTTLQLDHANVAKTVAFGREDDQFALVSEFPQGESVDAWISEHGPMPPDAVLRIALQVTSALGAANFLGLTHGAIQPSNLMIVPGKIAEGGWPFVKLMNFGLAGLTSEGASQGSHVVSEFSSPEQVEHGISDFRSEIYSLGATLCFLLTGAFYSAEPRSLQTRRFAKPLRNLIAPMLRPVPGERPQDPVLFAGELRKCLAQTERRQTLANRFGIPFTPVSTRSRSKILAPLPKQLIASVPVGTPPPPDVFPEPSDSELADSAGEKSGFWTLGRALAIAAILLALMTVAAVFLPAPVNMILSRNRDREALGVPIGVPQPSAPQTASSAGAATAAGPSTSEANTANAAPAPAPVTAANQPAADPAASSDPERNSSPAAAEQSSVPAAAPSNGPLVAALPLKPEITEEPRNEQTTHQTEEAPPPAQGPQTLWDRASGGRRKIQIQKENEENATASSERDQADAVAKNEAEPEESAGSKGPSGNRTTTTNTRRPGQTAPRYSRSTPNDTDQERPSPRSGGSVHARYVGMTPDGNLILRLPSGETVIVSPRAARLTVPPRHRTRRVVTERVYYPPLSPFDGPGY